MHCLLGEFPISFCKEVIGSLSPRKLPYDILIVSITILKLNLQEYLMVK